MPIVSCPFPEVLPNKSELEAVFAFVFSIDVYLDYLLNDISVEGWTTVVILISLLGGIQLLTLGVLGEYLWRASNDSKKRPLYLPAWHGPRRPGALPPMASTRSGNRCYQKS